MSKRNKRLGALCSGAIFAFMFVFFTRIHPLVLFDTDDWSYISYTRHAVPVWGHWNPTRVFPETFMPLAGGIAAYLVYPLTGDYLGAITITCAAVVGLFITGYAVMFWVAVRRKAKVSPSMGWMLTCLFLVLHFLVFRSAPENNLYMFGAGNLTCYFYYIIPDLLNCGLVMYLMVDDVLYDGWNKLRTGEYASHAVRYGLLVLALYLALFSNLYASAILAAYVGCQLLGEIWKLLKKTLDLTAFAQKNILRLAFILAWGIEQIFEMNGGRAQSLTEGKTHLADGLTVTLKGLLAACRGLNNAFLVLTALVAIYAAAAYFWRRRKHKERMSAETAATPLLLAGMGVLLGLYLVFLCSVSGGNIMTPGVHFGMMFCVFFILILGIAYALRNIRWMGMVLPLLIFILVFEVNTGGKTFVEENMGDLEPGICTAIGNDIIRQFQEADAAGETSMPLLVPKFDSDDNWPLADYGGGRIGGTLYEHSLIGTPMTDVVMIPSLTKNTELGVPVP